MRLLHVVPTYFPATRYGGPIYAVHGLCRALAARGHEVDVFTTNVDGGRDSDVPLGVPVTLDGVHIHYFPSPSAALAGLSRRIYRSPDMRVALAERIHYYDLLHLHSVFLWPTFVAARAAERARIPYVVSPRGMLVTELIRRKSPLVKRAWIRLIEKHTFRRASAVHFTAQREWDDARLISIPLPAPFIVPNGIDLPPPSPPARLDDT
ncbi:MAG TPA: glycosyltransferase, partial [Thermoanaerobaculia bacterium]|nr:glycosyltransferase [Thermoanaerobaculia bacterium]